jgi:hypothetical protein
MRLTFCAAYGSTEDLRHLTVKTRNSRALSVSSQKSII